MVLKNVSMTYIYIYMCVCVCACSCVQGVTKILGQNARMNSSHQKTKKKNCINMFSEMTVLFSLKVFIPK